MTIVSGAVSTNTGPSNRQKLDMGRGRKSKLTDLGIPIIKRSKKSKKA